jgi:hypothetical protein
VVVEVMKEVSRLGRAGEVKGALVSQHPGQVKVVLRLEVVLRLGKTGEVKVAFLSQLMLEAGNLGPMMEVHQLGEVVGSQEEAETRILLLLQSLAVATTAEEVALWRVVVGLCSLF